MKFLITFISIDITLDDSQLTDSLKSTRIRHDVVGTTYDLYATCDSISDIEAAYERAINYVDGHDHVMHPTRKTKVLNVEYLPPDVS